MEGHDVTFIKTDGGDINFTAVSDQDAFVKERATFVFNSSKTLVATYWRPKVEVKAGMFLCHGYGEYISPIYDELAEFLSSHGILVFGHDHVGHGRSSGQRVQVRFSNFCSFEEVFSHWVVITVMCSETCVWGRSRISTVLTCADLTEFILKIPLWQHMKYC